MTGEERRILGINGKDEARTLYDIVLRQATTLAKLSSDLCAMEKARDEAKATNEERLRNIERCLREIDAKVDDLSLRLTAIPGERNDAIKKAIEECREEHEGKSSTRRQKISIYSALVFGIAGLIFGIVEYLLR